VWLTLEEVPSTSQAQVRIAYPTIEISWDKSPSLNISVGLQTAALRRVLRAKRYIRSDYISRIDPSTVRRTSSGKTLVDHVFDILASDT
jgi:hypothetical protein